MKGRRLPTNRLSTVAILNGLPRRRSNCRGYERNRMTASEQQQNQISSKGVKGLERGIERRLVDLIRIPSSARGYLLPFHPSLVWSRKSILSDFFIVVPRSTVPYRPIQGCVYVNDRRVSRLVSAPPARKRNRSEVSISKREKCTLNRYISL